MSEFRWALIGPGRIARRFADAVRQLPETRLAVVIGRDEGRARAFANEWSDPATTRVGTDLTELLRTRDVDAVYSARPHAFTRRCVTVTPSNAPPSCTSCSRTRTASPMSRSADA